MILCSASVVSSLKGEAPIHLVVVDFLKEHEKGKAHHANMQTWRELEDRLKSGKAIDSVSQELHVLETQHWKAVLSRIIAIVCHLAEHNQALRGHSEKLFKPHNGNFLGQVELMAQFDPIMSEHLRRIEKKEIKDHYFSNIIQNELDAILQKVKVLFCDDGLHARY